MVAESRVEKGVNPRAWSFDVKKKKKENIFHSLINLSADIILRETRKFFSKVKKKQIGFKFL